MDMHEWEHLRLKGYRYQPHRSIPEALADFLEAQGRPITEACLLDIGACDEGLSGWRLDSMRSFARLLETTLERMRLARVEYSDGFGMNLYLALLDEDSWCVRYIDAYIRVKRQPVEEDE